MTDRHQPIPYEPASADTRRRKLPRWFLVCAFAFLAIPSAPMVKNIVAYRIDRYRCLHFRLPPGTVVFESDPSAVAALL